MRTIELLEHLALVLWAVALEPSRAQGTAFTYQGWHYSNDVATPHVGPMAQDL